MRRRRLLGAVWLGSVVAAGWLLLLRGSEVPQQVERATASAAARVEAPALAPSGALPLPSPVERAEVVASTSPQQPASEDAFLQRLLELNRTDKPRALELARRGEGWYSDEGVRAEARKAMIVTLLVDLGHMSEARTEARELIRRYPESRYLPLVQGVTGIHPRPGGPGQAGAR
jgi:hypothetical protein